MNNLSPSVSELIEAVQEHLATKVLPTIADAQLKFQTLVAAHVLGVVLRELTLGDGMRAESAADLERLIGTATTGATSSTDAAAALCGAIREGRFDGESDRRDLVAALAREVERAVALWNPAFLKRVKSSI